MRYALLVRLLHLAVACSALALAPTSVAAQDGAEPGARELALRASLHEQAVAATALYVVSAALGTAGIITGDLGLVGEIFYPDASTQALFYGGILGGTVGLVLLCVGIGLDVDRHSRRNALERAAAHARLVPGPGDFGLALAIGFP